jgi:hypothetical protein
LPKHLPSDSLTHTRRTDCSIQSKSFTGVKKPLHPALEYAPRDVIDNTWLELHSVKQAKELTGYFVDVTRNTGLGYVCRYDNTCRKFVLVSESLNRYFMHQSLEPLGLTRRYRPFASNSLYGFSAAFAFLAAVSVKAMIWGPRVLKFLKGPQFSP